MLLWSLSFYRFFANLSNSFWPSQFTQNSATDSTWDQFQPSTCREALSPVHAPASTTICILGDAFITSFCTGHTVAPNKVFACGCMLSHRPSVFDGNISSRSVLMHGAEASPCHLHCLGSKHPDVCTRSSHHSALGMSLPQTTPLHVVVCFPIGCLILRGSVSQGLF